MVFATIISFSSLLDFAGYGTFSRLISYANGGSKTLNLAENISNGQQNSKHPNWSLIKDLNGVIGIVFLTLSLFVFLILSTFGTWSVSRVISFTSNQSEMWYSWVIVLFTASISMYGKRYTTILHGLNYVPLLNRYNIYINIITLLVAYISLTLSQSIFLLIMITQLSKIILILTHWYLVRYQIEEQRFMYFKSFKWNKDLFGTAWTPSWKSMLVIIFSTGIIELSGILYAQVGDPEKIASYLLAIRLINIITNVSKAPFYSKIPYFTTLRAQGDLISLASETKRSAKISLYVFVLGVIATTIMIEPILELIQSNIDFVPISMWSFIGIVWFLERHHAIHAQIYSTTNDIPFYIPVAVSGIFNVFLIFLLIDKLGYWAFPLAQFISNLIINNWWNVKISLKSLNQSSEYLIDSFLKPIIFLISAELFILII